MEITLTSTTLEFQTEESRRQEIATILARGVLRLLSHRAVSEQLSEDSHNSSNTGLSSAKNHRSL